MTIKIKRLLLVLTTPLFLFFLYRFCHNQTDGFEVRKLRKAFENQEIIHLSSSLNAKEEPLIAEILSQPLSYIGRGGQCYAFASEDGKYVVKLLKYNNNYPRIWLRLFPFFGRLETYRLDKIASKQKKLKGEYRSYQIALQDLQQETGIVYVHFDKGLLPQEQTLKIFDKINIRYDLKADQFQFYIQKRGDPFYATLEKIISHGNGKKALREMALYLHKRSEKTILDKDDGIWRNFAFFEDHPFQIDIGQFVYDPSLSSLERRKENLLSFTADFRRWLQKTHPDLEKYFIEQLSCLTKDTEGQQKNLEDPLLSIIR